MVLLYYSIEVPEFLANKRPTYIITFQWRGVGSEMTVDVRWVVT